MTFLSSTAEKMRRKVWGEWKEGYISIYFKIVTHIFVFFIIALLFYFTISTILFLTLPVSILQQTKKAVNNIEVLLYCIIKLDFNKPTVL